MDRDIGNNYCSRFGIRTGHDLFPQQRFSLNRWSIQVCKVLSGYCAKKIKKDQSTGQVLNKAVNCRVFFLIKMIVNG